MYIFYYFSLEELTNRIVVHKIESLESCTHEVALPPGHEYIPLVPLKGVKFVFRNHLITWFINVLFKSVGEPVKTYPFTLDSFQKESILCIDNNQSVLVSAHTSAGKTVVAE